MKKINIFLIFGILLSIVSCYLGYKKSSIDKQYTYYQDKYESIENQNEDLLDQIHQEEESISSAEKVEKEFQEKIKNHEP